MFDYDVMSENEAQKERYSLLEDGDYDGVIFDCIDKISQNSGNPMFEMYLHIYDEKGNKSEVKDWITFTPKMMWKVIHCCASAGVLAEYESKKLHPDLLKGKNIRVKLKIQEGGIIPVDKLKGKPMGSCYPSKNSVDDYLFNCDVKPSGMKPLPEVKDNFNDDLPF